MADYWKSTGKHYCDFCKCWTADNKASIEFHEKGKNHQHNVKRRLAEIKRNSVQKRKNEEDSKRMFDQMEKAALAAVQKDVNSANVSVGKSDLRNIVKANADSSSGVGKESTYPWQVMTAPQGITYYYNSLAGESTWQMPEVFKNLNENKRKEKEELKEKKKPKETSKDPYRAQPVVEEPVEVRNVHPLLGGWSTVRTYDQPAEGSSSSTSSETKADNKQDESGCEENTSSTKETEESDAEERDTGKKFKEKTIKKNIVGLSDEPVAFKKRRTGNRNVRKRNDDD